MNRPGSADNRFIQRALTLAAQGIGLSSPGPCVGALLVDLNDNIVGEGVYTYEGKKHAEVLALEQAGDRARSATLYINLEPHAHQGRTPPCTDALIAAGIKRVVASMPDPNPRVSGRGFDQLRAAGIQVEIGALASEARKLNESFARFILRGTPGDVEERNVSRREDRSSARHRKKPGRNSRRGWITGEAARAHVHELRHQSDAVLAGIGTILADNPLLSDRSGRARRRPLLRVILDATLRTPLQSRIVASASKTGDDASDVLIFSGPAPPHKKTALIERGIRIQEVAVSRGQLDLHEVLRQLSELEIISLLIEGGSTVNASALASGIVDKVFLYYAPRLLGSSAVPFAAQSADNFQPAEGVSIDHRTIDGHSLQDTTVHRFADDIAIEGYLRNPYKP